MQFPDVPPISKTQVDKAGFVLADPKSSRAELEKAIEIVNAWRVCHAYPMTTFANGLRKRTVRFKGAIVAQRLKRLPTITFKLRRFKDMKLSRMQDIGGVRAILNTVDEVQKLQHSYEEGKRWTHILDQPVDDYISHPKSDGYRGVHMVYKYNNTLDRTGKSAQYTGLRIELQIRTKLQHQWATTVETVGTMRGEALKSMQGNPKWRELFAYISSAFAIAEGTPVLEAHQNLTTQEIFDHIYNLDKQLKAREAIRGWSATVNVIHKNRSRFRSHYYLVITLNTKARNLQIMGFAQNQLESASTVYGNLEKQFSGDDDISVVLVATGKIRSLPKAYPNFYLDTEEFLRKVSAIIHTVESESV